MAQRLSKKNVVWHVEVEIEASSEETGFPAEALKDQQRQNFWRSALGWTVVSGFNDRIDFDRGGVKAATINPGHYATSFLYAAAVVAALEAADATPVWACAYNSASHVFTISTAAHSFTLLFSTGANVATGRSAHRDLSFAQADLASIANARTGSATTYQSRHRLRLVVPAEARPDGITVAAVCEHNFSTTPTTHNVRLRMFSDSGYSSNVFDEDFSTVNPDDPEGLRRFYLADANVDYIELLIEDQANPDGYAELGVLWLSSYIEFEDRLDRALTDDPEDFSRIEQGPDGTVYVDFGRNRSRLGLVWRPLADDQLESMRDFLRDLAAGEAWLLDLDSDTPGTGAPGDILMAYYGAFFSRPKTLHLSKTPTAEVAVITFEFVVYL